MMNSMFAQNWNIRRATRRVDAEAAVNLSKTRAWYANNTSVYGFTELKDLYAQRIVTIEVETLQTAIRAAVERSSAQVNDLISALVTRTTDWKKRYQLASTGTLQPLDEKGNPLPIVLAGVYDIGFPMQRAGTAWGNDRVSRAKMTVSDAARATMDVMLKDADWMIRHILAAIFTNASYTFTDPQYGAITVQVLANADSVTYPLTSGVSSTDNHFLAQAAGIADATDPYGTIYTELAEHPGNTGPFVAYIASDLVATTMALSGFSEVRDPDVVYSITNPVLSPGVVDINRNQYSATRIPGYSGEILGDRVLGKVDGMWIVEWSRLPSTYIIAQALGANDVVGMREEPEPELQGLQPEFASPDGNLYEYRFLRHAGFGIMNRTGAVVMRIGNGSYAIPTGYTALLSA